MNNGDLYPLRGKVRHYEWGGRQFIPELLGAEPDGRPWAEYWLGAHPGDPSDVCIDGQWRPLDRLIAEEPRRWLGRDTAQQFGQLPYLMKILDVARPLSIQVHPNREQAKAGFEREEAAGIALDAPERNFKDPNHKPELALALSDFWVLYGFRPAAEMGRELARFASLKPLAGQLEGHSVKALFERLMNANDGQLAQWLLPLFAAIGRDAPPQSPDYWIGAWRSLHDSDEAAIDRGVFGFLMMNLLCLKPGQSLFQDANVPHAYLRGQCVEIMANSDNVLRGGLTPKHVDPAALVAHIDFDATESAASSPPADFREFQFNHVALSAGGVMTVPANGLATVMVLRGTLRSGTGKTLTGGESLIATNGLPMDLTCLESAQVVMARPGAPLTGALDPRQDSHHSLEKL